MILLWALPLLGGRALLEKRSGLTGFFLRLYPILSILAGVTGLIFSYLGFFREREERFIWLSIAHMALSTLLIAVGVVMLLVLIGSMIPLG